MMLFPEPIDSDKHHESQDGGGLCIDPLNQLGSLPPPTRSISLQQMHSSALITASVEQCEHLHL